MVLALFAATYISRDVRAQISPGVPSEEILPPKNEVFQVAGELIVPWRSAGCKFSNPFLRDKNCKIVTMAEFERHDSVTLYDDDGTVWYNFSLSPESENHFDRKTKKGFEPFFPPPPSKFPAAIILRLVAESKSWYEVEVNEKTRETKYVLKADPMWARDTWREWLIDGVNLKIDYAKTTFLDKPQGKAVSVDREVGIDNVAIIKVDGEWAFVRMTINQTVKSGWIRWRNGREILVGCIFNDYVIP